MLRRNDGGDKKVNGRPRLSCLMGLLLCAVIMLMGCGPVTRNAVNLDDLVRDIERKAYLVRQFRADFVKIRHAAVFGRDLMVNGSLVYQKPNRFHLVFSGDINVEILSDGSRITLIHNAQDSETYEIQGDRDMSRFADPLMILIQSLGKGGLRRFSAVERQEREGLVVLATEPVGDARFEHTAQVILAVSDHGEMRRVKIIFAGGDWDEIVFHSWRALTQQDPEILRLEEALSNESHRSPSG